MVCNHSIVGPMVDNHQKPLKPMVAWLQNNQKTIEPNGCPKPFHSMVIVPTKIICCKNSSGPRELRPCDPRDVALAPILQLAELLINNGFQFKERQSNNWIYFAMANRSSLLHFEKASVLHHRKDEKDEKVRVLQHAKMCRLASPWNPTEAVWPNG